MIRCLMAYNPTAGRFPSRLLVERAAAIFERAGWQVYLEQTYSGEHITLLARQAAQDGLDHFIVAGGDGSLNRATIGLLGAKTALGVLPVGTANVWAQELGMPGLNWARWLALEESARRLVDGEIRDIDVGLCNGQPFLLWAGLGLDAFVVHRLEPRNRWEKTFAVVQYATSIVWSASVWHGMNLHVLAEKQEISGHYLLGLVSNIRLYAGGVTAVSPNALVDDGLMELWLFKGENLGDTVQQVLSLLSGGHVYSEKVQFARCRNIELKSDSPLYVQVDGEPVDGNGSIQVSVQAKAMRVLVPRSRPNPLFEEQQGGN